MEISKEFNAKEIEGQVRDSQSGPAPRDGESIMFIEGPPTMNGTPHAGHLRGRVIKDFWYRYKTLSGYNVVFNAGWDTQGLPVELQAQKELGVEGSRDQLVKSVGIEKLVAECKRIVKEYNRQWVEADRLLGMSMNQDDAYWTYKDEFIEREWQYLRRANERGILEEDFTVIAYCPSCQTSLSHAEVNQGYEMVKDPSLYYKAKLVDEDAHLVVWTTMPFTLVTDAMIGLDPDEEYCYIKVEQETWIVGRTRLEEFAAEADIEYDIIRTAKGAEFEGKKYIHPLLDQIPALAELAKESGYHVAVAEEFVDASTGSGLVHLSPANGEEDIAVANRRGVKVFCPIDDQAKFTEDAARYSGMYVRDADRPIVESLKEAGALVKIGRIKHKYPLCWRSRHPIVYLARKGWFYKLDRLGQDAIDAAKSVEYFFEAPKNRFLAIIGERHPWCISRERFWGCPLPAWNCEACGNRDWFYSRKELVAAAADLSDGDSFELHRPWIDGIKVKCSKCGSTDTSREPYVLDTWHNSGSAPYSSLTDAQYDRYIPAPFFTEGIDQTRGWAYTLLIENVIFSGRAQAPYRSFLFQGHVLDEKGGKMSKSLGNVIDAQQLLTEYPVDLVRFYFLWKSSPIEPLNFSTKEMMSRPYQILSTLYHLHLYYSQNSEYDGFDGTTIQQAKESGSLEPPDVWLLSKLQRLVKNVAAYNDSCRYHESAKSIEEFIINVLSQVYIPITRGQLWQEDDSQKARRFAIYAVLQDILRTLDILIHPFCPYTSQYLYAGAFGKASILEARWPSPDPALIDGNIEESFDLLSTIVSVAAAARMKGKLKRRWPLNEARICVGAGAKTKLEPLAELLRAQLNVERHDMVELECGAGLEQITALQKAGLPVAPVISLERKKIGPKAKQHMPGLVKAFEGTDPQEIVDGLDRDGSYTFEVDGARISLDADDFVMDIAAQDGYAVSARDGITVFVSASRNKEMMAKGLVKDIARRVQALRKEKGFNPTDILESASILDLDQEQLEMVSQKSDELAFLVRVKQIEFTESAKEYKDDDLDGQKIRIWVG